MEKFRIAIDIIGALFMLVSSAYVIALVVRGTLDQFDGAPRKVINMKSYIKKKRDLK